MDIDTLKRTTEILPLLGYELKKAGGYHVGACPFCGGTDRFTVKHTRDGDRWHCRHCGDGKYHTVIDFIMLRDGVDFKTALASLGGEAVRSIPTAKPTQPQPKPLVIPSTEWRADAWQEVTQANDRLFTDEGKSARDFLTSRGLARGTWYAWRLGFGFAYDSIVKRNRPAILIPWWDIDREMDTITAIKYRFVDLDPNPKAMRYTAKGGSGFDLPFGLCHALESDSVLLLVEGEMNALSAWQLQPRGVTCLSFGSEGGGRVDVLEAIAKRYQHVFVWADDLWDNPKQEQRAKDLRGLVKGRGKALRSVVQNGVKHDANQLLQFGALDRFLFRVLGVECVAHL
jgi:hypothetical protein